jgi:hypothetical protein
MLTLPALGVEAARPPRPHHVRFYEQDDTLIEEVSDFLDTALRAGDAALVIATEAHRAALQRRLGGIGSREGQPGWYPGALVMLDAQQTLDHP